MRRIERPTRTRRRAIVDGEPGQPGASKRHQPTRPRAGARSRRQGQSLVEFAVVLPIFLLILAGILDFGLGLYSQMTIINAAREGARIGAVTIVGVDPTASVDNRVRAMTAGLDQSKLDVIITCQTPSGSSFVACGSSAWQSGDAVRVEVDYDYTMLWPLALGNSLQLSSTVQMRIE
jgi:Flp pilus assembly protein TadG